ncbi:MAG: AbrB/MazE/SpoVT family DNA-binding domain-containing protein [Candidatus Kerfeldbacteria bacterium]|nr:AbrB/MazE/SpoVT family DNA-binding domain-containing protein [Candidatus Kerfeldbacteria bacterium]
MNTTTVLLSQKCQIVVPKAIRQRLKLKAGMRISMDAIDNHHAIITTQPKNYTDALSGLGADVWKKLGGVRHLKKLRKEWDK